MSKEQLKKLYDYYLSHKKNKKVDLILLRLCIDKLLKESEA